MTTLGEFGGAFFFNQKRLKKLAQSQKNKKEYLEQSLDIALKKIQKADAKILFSIIMMNMKDGPEKTIQYVARSFAMSEYVEINGVKFLIGTARKSP